MTNASNTRDTWHGEHTLEVPASPEALWSLLRDVAGWPAWNGGVERIELEGPFADGTWFTMKAPGQEAFRSQLLEVRENERFVDETQVGDLVVRVTHRLERLGERRTRVVYAVEAVGPDASEVGPTISSDFPQVLEALSALAVKRG
jgi:uncharacterized protein YndB with AHSA1/START domain